MNVVHVSVLFSRVVDTTCERNPNTESINYIYVEFRVNIMVHTYRERNLIVLYEIVLKEREKVRKKKHFFLPDGV